MTFEDDLSTSSFIERLIVDASDEMECKLNIILTSAAEESTTSPSVIYEKKSRLWLWSPPQKTILLTNKASQWLVIVSFWLPYIQDVNQTIRDWLTHTRDVYQLIPRGHAWRNYCTVIQNAYVGYIDYPLWVRVDDNGSHDAYILVIFPIFC